MDVTINKRGNGICPDCRIQPVCKIHSTLIKDLSRTPDPRLSGMEMVVYDCPNFTEK